MKREEYFNYALKIIDKRDEYKWRSQPISKILPVMAVDTLDYYDALISKVNNKEMYLAFAQYSHYTSLDENEQLLVSDYAMIFYIKDLEWNNYKKLLDMQSREYNILLMDSDRDFRSYVLPEVIRKITEVDMSVEDFFKNI